MNRMFCEEPVLSGTSHAGLSEEIACGNELEPGEIMCKSCRRRFERQRTLDDMRY